MFAAISIVLAVLGVLCLYVSWRGLFFSRSLGQGATRLLTPGGWLLLAGSMACWTEASGAEFGISYTLLVIPLVAWLVALRNMKVREYQPRIAEAGRLSLPGLRSFSRHFLLFLLVVPFAALVATLATAALARLLPWSPVNAMVLAVLAMPLVWGLVSYWLCADPKLVRSTVWLTAMGGLGAAFIYL